MQPKFFSTTLWHSLFLYLLDTMRSAVFGKWPQNYGDINKVKIPGLGNVCLFGWHTELADSSSFKAKHSSSSCNELKIYREWGLLME